ncbi:MAG: type I phosphomannose isomerase catalytic subunit [Planctomycetota bacterium]
MHQPYPLTFEPILKEKVWGGTRLAGLGKDIEPGKRYGESWELADLASTSAGGGGGGSAVSRIANGPLAGKTIQDAIRAWGGALLGKRGLIAARQFGFRGDPVFPLLIKFLDAAEHLSVQAHPSPAYAAANPSAHLKTESWYVMEAEHSNLGDGTQVAPTVFVGTKPGTKPEVFKRRIHDGSVLGTLDAAGAVPGDCWTLPSGTLHALGAGVLVAEVQTPSDTTFRVYDWTSEYNRPKRELHIDPALESIDFDGGQAAAPRRSGEGQIARTEFYTIDRESPTADGLAMSDGECVVVMGVEGNGVVRVEGADPASGVGTLDVHRGSTVLLPAAITARTRVCAADHAGSSGPFGVLLIRIGAG